MPTFNLMCYTQQVIMKLVSAAYVLPLFHWILLSPIFPLLMHSFVYGFFLDRSQQIAMHLADQCYFHICSDAMLCCRSIYIYICIYKSVVGRSVKIYSFDNKFFVNYSPNPGRFLSFYQQLYVGYFFVTTVILCNFLSILLINTKLAAKFANSGIYARINLRICHL